MAFKLVAPTIVALGLVSQVAFADPTPRKPVAHPGKLVHVGQAGKQLPNPHLPHGQVVPSLPANLASLPWTNWGTTRLRYCDPVHGTGQYISMSKKVHLLVYEFTSQFVRSYPLTFEADLSSAVSSNLFWHALSGMRVGGLRVIQYPDYPNVLPLPWFVTPGTEPNAEYEAHLLSLN